MNLYWPNMYTVKDGRVERYSTYNACKTITEASKCVKSWVANAAVNEYPIISWIDVTDYSTNEYHVERKVEYGAHYYSKKYDSDDIEEVTEEND